MDTAIGNEETIKSELDIFTQPSFQTTHLKGLWQRFTPAHTCAGHASKDTPLTIIVPKSASIYTDLNFSFLVVGVKIVKKDDGTNYADAANVAFAQNSMHFLFKNMSMYINSTKFEPSLCVQSLPFNIIVR